MAWVASVGGQEVREGMVAPPPAAVKTHRFTTKPAKSTKDVNDREPRSENAKIVSLLQ